LCNITKQDKLCYRKDDRAMRPIIYLFYPNFVHAYVHHFVRIWFWTTAKILLNAGSRIDAGSQTNVGVLKQHLSTSHTLVTSQLPKT